MSGFKKATKRQQKLRLALTGPAGSGKTFTALTLAKHLGERVALIDSERGSASKYAGDVADFDALELDVFSIRNYLAAIRDAACAGYDVLVIDSLSHAWSGKGGVLEEADKRGGKFQAWKELTPMQQSLVDAILSYPGHVIATMRSKMSYEVTTEENRNGTKSTKVEKLGLAPVQREGMEYEFDVIIDMDVRNNGHVSKSRCIALSGEVISKPGKPLADTLKAWLGEGEVAERPRPFTAPEQTASAPTSLTRTSSQTRPHGMPHGSSTATPAIDEYGLTVPSSPCPIVREGKANAGKRWSELNGPVIEKMFTEAGDKMTSQQVEWAVYLIERRKVRKAIEASQEAAKAEAERLEAERAAGAESDAAQ